VESYKDSNNNLSQVPGNTENSFHEYENIDIDTIKENIKKECEKAIKLLTEINKSLRNNKLTYADKPLSNEEKSNLLIGIRNRKLALKKLSSLSTLNPASYDQLQHIITSFTNLHKHFVDHKGPQIAIDKLTNRITNLTKESNKFQKTLKNDHPFVSLYLHFNEFFNISKNDNKKYTWLSKIHLLYENYIDLINNNALTPFIKESYLSRLQLGLIRLYFNYQDAELAKTNKHNPDNDNKYLFLQNAKILKTFDPPLIEASGEINFAAYNAIKAKNPFSLAFNRMHAFLGNVDTELTDELSNLFSEEKINKNSLPQFIKDQNKLLVYDNFGNRIYRTKLDFNEMNNNQAIYLYALEQKLLDAYFDIRQHHRNSRLGDELENFLKSPYGLNLVAKYNIDIPHKPPSNMKIDLLTRDPVAKKVAFVDSLLLTDKVGNFDIKLFNKLKTEYDEVVLFAPPGLTKDTNSIVNRLQNAFKHADLNKIINVRAVFGNSLDEVYKNYLASEIDYLDCKGKPNVMTSIFQTKFGLLQDFAKLSDDLHPAEHPERFPKLYDLTKDDKGQSSKIICFSKKEVNEIKNECFNNGINFNTAIAKSALTKPDVSQEPEAALRQYITARKVEKNLKKSAYNSFFARFAPSKSAGVKIAAAEKIMAHLLYERYILDPDLNKQVVEEPKDFTTAEIAAFNNDRLGELIKANYKYLPESVKKLVVLSGPTSDKKSEYIAMAILHK
jgi:hypothetical protein